MPEISRFYGIVVSMYFNDHAPPHVHVKYAGKRAVLGITPVALLDGRLPPRGLRLAMKWMALHVQELSANWAAARVRRPLRRIAPLG